MTPSTSTSWQDFLGQYGLQLEQAGKDFVKQNASASLELGQDTIKAILSQAINDNPDVGFSIADPGPAATPEARELYEANLTKRSQIAQLVAQAELQNATLTADLKSKAITFAQNIAATVLPIGEAALFKVIGL